MVDISVIVSTVRREDILELTFKALVAIKNTSLKEIIIVIDDVANNYKFLQTKIDSRLKIYLTGGKGVSAARNLGAQESTARVLLFIDNDIIISESLIEYIEKYYQMPKHHLLFFNWMHTEQINELKKNDFFGRYLNFYNPNDCLKTRMLNAGDVWEETFFESIVAGFPECCFCLLRTDFMNVGGFNEQIKVFEGNELWKRLKKSGVKKYVEPSVTVLHNEIDKYVEEQDFLNARKKLYHRVSENEKQILYLKKILINLTFKNKIAMLKFAKYLRRNKIAFPLYKRIIALLANTYAIEQ